MLAKLCQDKGNSRTKHRPLTTIPHLDSRHFLLKRTSTPSIVTITLTELQTWTCWEFSSCCIFHWMMAEPWEIQHNMHLLTKKDVVHYYLMFVSQSWVKIRFSLQPVIALHVRAMQSVLLSSAPTVHRPWLRARLSHSACTCHKCCWVNWFRT